MMEMNMNRCNGVVVAINDSIIKISGSDIK